MACYFSMLSIISYLLQNAHWTNYLGDTESPCALNCVLVRATNLLESKDSPKGSEAMSISIKMFDGAKNLTRHVAGKNIHVAEGCVSMTGASTGDRFGSVIKDMITETSGKGLINRMLFLCQKQLPPIMPRDVDKRQIDTSLPSFSLFYMIAAELRNVEFLFIGQPAKVEDYQFPHGTTPANEWFNDQVNENENAHNYYTNFTGKLVLDAQEQEKQNIIEKSDIDFIAKFMELVPRICSVTRAIDIACEIAEALIDQYKFEDAPVNIRTKRQVVFISIASCKRAANLAYSVLRHTLALYNHSQNRIETVNAMILSTLTVALKDTPSSLSTAAQSKRTLEQFILVDFAHNFLMLGWLAKYPGTEKKAPFQRTSADERQSCLQQLADDGLLISMRAMLIHSGGKKSNAYYRLFPSDGQLERDKFKQKLAKYHVTISEYLQNHARSGIPKNYKPADEMRQYLKDNQQHYEQYFEACGSVDDETSNDAYDQRDVHLIPPNDLQKLFQLFTNQSVTMPTDLNSVILTNLLPKRNQQVQHDQHHVLILKCQDFKTKQSNSCPSVNTCRHL
ncbi:unnamed protein product, partial [Didymodactylos carnosus]